MTEPLRDDFTDQSSTTVVHAEHHNDLAKAVNELNENGVPGATGPSGPAGPTGPSGPQGTAGNDGQAGPSGPTGPSGPQGIQGVQGEQGVPGATGPAGPGGGGGGEVGATGPQGIQGVQGEQGPSGPQGSQGTQGPSGPQGEQGPSGPQGETGPAGGVNWMGMWDWQATYQIDDVVNYGGAAWIATAPSTNLPAPSHPEAWELFADKGQPGNDGAQGPTGPQGPQGIPGATGPQGIQGEQGTPGAVGADGLQWRGNWSGIVDYVRNDAVNYQGSVYITTGSEIVGTPPSNDDGATTSLGWSLFVAEGAPGAQGIQGTQGIQGVPGIEGPTGPTGPQGESGQAAGKILYFAPSDASDIPTYKTLLVAPSAGPEQTIVTSVSGTSDVLISAWATDPGVIGTVEISAGTAFRRIYAAVSTGTARIHWVAYKRDEAGVETVVRDEFSPPFSNTVVDLIDWINTSSTVGQFLSTDRITGRLYAQRVSGPTSFNVTTYYEGTNHASSVQTTISAGAQGEQGPPGPAINVTVSSTEPASPVEGDVWIQV